MSTIRNKDKWDSLSMKEKSDMMKVAVQQGIYNLSDIRKAYNEYAEGGDTEKEYYAGTLPEVEISTPRIDSYIAQPSSTYTAPYISEFPDIRFIGSRYDRDTLTDKGGKPADDISYKERWERQKRERTIEDWKNLGRGFSNTVGTAIDLASLIYGGGWAATRLLKGNRASSIGQKFAKYVLPSNAADNIGDAADFMIDPSVSKAAELGAGVALGQWRDFGNAYRQASELGSQALNVYNTTSDYTKGKTFAEGGNIYDGTTESTQQMNTSPRPITTGGAGYVPPSPNFDFPRNIQDARIRLYNQISPVWGFTDDTLKATLNTLMFNKNAWTENQEKVTVDDPYVDGVWAEYLQIPEDKRRSKYKLEPSEYRPTVGDEKEKTYYKIPIESEAKDALIEEGATLPIGSNKLSTTLMGYNHGEHTIGKGVDPNKGEYISYYDRWDLNPLSSRYSSETKFSNNPIVKKLGLLDNRKYGDLSFGLGKPLDFYDRLYLDDYYGVDTTKDIPKNTYYGGWLPELFVNDFGDGFTTNRMGNETEFGVPYNYNKKSLGGPLVQLANKYEEGGTTDESNNIVDWIIGEEGFNNRPENIGDGKITLGSGLTNSKWHKIYNKKGTWTAEDNRAAVAEEVENRRKWAEQNVPNWSELPADSQNALLSYKYNYNFTPKNSPKLFKALEDRNYEEAARQMDATSSNPRFRKGLQARRQREQEMFMRGIDSMNAPEPEIVEEIPQEESIYTPPQRVLDNMAAHNGKYMIMGNPPLAGVKNTVLDALRRLKALNLFVEGGPLVDLANRYY